MYGKVETRFSWPIFHGGNNNNNEPIFSTEDPPFSGQNPFFFEDLQISPFFKSIFHAHMFHVIKPRSTYIWGYLGCKSSSTIWDV